MKRSSSLHRVVLVLGIVILALAMLVAQIAALRGLPTLAASWQGWGERAQGALAKLSSETFRVLETLKVLPGASSPEREVQDAWQRAQQAGTYRFATRLVQTTYPAPALVNVGRSSRQETIYLEGDVDLPQRTMLMSLWQGGGSVLDPRDGVEVRIEGNQAYGRPIGGEWQQMDNFAGSFAPGNDALAYLAGAKNVQRISESANQRISESTNQRISESTNRRMNESTNRRMNESPTGDYALRFTHYVFDLDGPAFADYMRDQLEQQLREAGELPPGVYLDTAEQFRDAIGDGEVWIDDDGLPLRLTMHVEYPQQANGERIKVDIQTDFSNFPRDMLAQADFRSLGNFGSLLRHWPSAGHQAGVGLAVLGLMLGVVIHRGSKKVYAAVVSVIILSMVVAPLLQSQQVYAFSQKQAARQAESEQRQKEQEAVQELQEKLYNSDWDPHRDPLRNTEYATRNTQHATPPPASNGTSSTEDDDNDGVPNDVDPCDDDNDCDDDGLTDLQETRLGTNLTEKDTDADQINDAVEVAGFSYNKQWYTDPVNPDTNNDGLLDTLECPQLMEDSPSPAERCQDTDNDGTPDVFDRDNDDDGVPDRVDLSPFSKMDNDGSPFDADHPLALIVNNLQPGEPAFVDFQLRPANPDHLWQALNVLDWPSGDAEGQIYRKQGNYSTFADVAPEGQSVAPNASNGDVRLIPMLEIEMTGDTIPLQLTDPQISIQVEGEITGTVNLAQDVADVKLDFTFEAAQSYEVKIQGGSCLKPGDTVYTYTNVVSGTTRTIDDAKLVDLADGEHIVTVSDGTNTECADLGNVINGPYDYQMIDPEPLTPYGISVREKNKAGVLLAYVPLGLVQDETGGDRVAFSARMPYRLTTDNWGDAQQVRVVWLVQMLLDHCTRQPCSDDANWVLDQLQVVYTYTEDWYLAGLAVREDHGLEIAIVYEDPSQESSNEARRYDDFLWKLAHGLDATFMTGRDDEGDGQPDITISEIDRRFDITSTATITERWGIPLTVTLGVETFAYEHEDYVAHIMMTETRRILSDTFTAWVDQGSDAPTLLFARETRCLRVNLDEDKDVALQSDLPDGNGKLLTMSLDEAQEETGAFLSWAPYRYRNGEWESYPIDEYWDKMEVRFKDIFDESDEETRRGQVLMAQSFYIALFHGQSALVQVGVDITGNFEAQQTDKALTAGLKVGFSGGGIARFITASMKAWKDLFGVPFTIAKAKKAATEKAESALMWKGIKTGALAFVTFTRVMLVLFTVAEKTGEYWLTHMLNGVGVALSLYVTVTLCSTMYQAIRGSAEALSTLTAGPTALTKGLLLVGFIISESIMWAKFASDMASSHTKPGSLAFNYALSIQIAATITALLWIGLGLLPGVGQIMAILGLFDALLGFICGLMKSDNPICMGLTGMLTMGIQWWIYGSNVMLDLTDPDRLQLGSFDQKFKDPALGMSVGNSLDVRGTVTNTIGFIDKMDIQGWQGLAYAWQYNLDTLQSSTFAYELSDGKRDIHGNLNRGDMTREWDGSDCREQGFDSRCYYDQDVNTQSPVEQAGINRPIPLYLNEGYAIPVQECWAIGVPFKTIPGCYVRTEKGTTPMDLSGMLKYDAFPATLDEFCTLAWSQGTYPPIPPQADQDGDGLRSKPSGGPDSNDRDWDSDDDGLSDFYEFQWGSNPQDYDSDNDGLSDREEAILGTDPNHADSDYDGLRDEEELDGWRFVYDFAADGSQLTAWVTSDPLTMDGDEDGWTDFQEKTYGFHPRVVSQKNILTFESNVREEDAPLLLLRLDETDGATTFRDTSGYGNNGTCTPLSSPLSGGTGGGCPAAGHEGKYGNAPHFDGVDDYVEVEIDVSETAYALALWFKSSCTDCGIFSVDDGTLGSGGHDRDLYLNGGNLCTRVWNNEVICTSGSNYADGSWHHVAHIFGGSAGGQKLYVDGVQRASGNKANSDFDWQTGLNIAFSPDASHPYFDGLIDEVIVFDRALSQPEIQELMARRYNTADFVVEPGDRLYYQASVKNELRGNYAHGLLSTDFPAALSSLPPEAFILNPQEEQTLTGTVEVSSTATSGVYILTQEADAFIADWAEASDYAEMLLHFSEEVTATTTFHDSSGNTPPRDGRCQSPNCPTTISGPFGNALQFDGVDDYVDASAVVTPVSGSALTFGGWVYPSVEMATRGAIFVFGTRNGEDRSEVYYEPSQNKFMYCSMSRGPVHCTYGSTTFDRDQWHHVMVTLPEGGTGYLYVNGLRQISFETISLAEDDRFEIGRKRYSEGVGQHFKGRIDEVVVFNWALSAEEIQDLYGRPVFDLPLDENSGATTFDDKSSFDNDAACQGERCPAAEVDGVANTAARFDGQDYLSVPASSALNLSNSDFTLSTWIAPEGDPPASSCPWRAEYYYYEYDARDNMFITDPFDEQPPYVTRCDAWPDYNWGTGSSPSGNSDNFGVRWVGTFEFKGGWYTFHVVTDDGFQLYIDGTWQLGKEWWEGQHDRTYRIGLDSNIHTIKFEYFEKTGSARAKLEISPAPLPHTQGILGAADYPAIQRVGNRVRIILNTPDGKKTYTTAGDVLTPGAWNHVVVTFDGATLTVYVDGVSVQEFAVSGVTSGQAFDIGRSTDRGQIQLQKLDVQSSNAKKFSIYYQEEDGNWEEVWSRVDPIQYTSYPVNVERAFQNGANVRVNGYDWQYKTYLTGTVTVRAMEPSDYEAADTFGPGGYNGVNLFWDERTDSVPFQGKIDEVAIYKRALSSDEVAVLYDADSMVSHLPLDDPPGSAAFEDAAGQSNGSCTGDHCPTAGVPGRDNMALLFDGQDDTVTVDADNAGQLYKLTLAAWVKFNSLDGATIPIVVVSPTVASLDSNGGFPAFNLGSHALQGATPLASGVWYHIAGTYDGENVCLYLNGDQEGCQAYTEQLPEVTSLRLSSVGQGASRSLDGLLDEVILYRRALTSADIQALYQATPQMLLLLDETVGATQFHDDSGNGHHGACSGNTCPAAGAKGQLGLAAQFDGANDYIAVPHSDWLMPEEEFTLAAWVKMTASEVDQMIIGKSTGHDGYALGTQDGQLYVQVWDSSGTRYAGQWGGIAPGAWTHVAVTWKTNGDLIGYINGEEAGRIPASSHPIGANTNPLRVGITPWSTSQYPVNGLIDHVTLYTRALWPYEVRQLFRFQAKWVEERQSTEITIDADDPTSTLESDETYRPNRDAIQLVSASDPTSYVRTVEVGVSTDGGHSYTWETAPVCEDAPGQGVAWCPTFTPTQGEGRYLLQTRATDIVGHVETPSQTYTFLVDDTPPQPGTAIAQGQILQPQRDPSAETAWLVGLNGTANDPAVAGSPGSGVASVSVKLTDTDPVTDTLQPQSATVNGSAWTADYRLSAADPTGTYTLTAQAADRVGNTSEFATLVTLGVDAAPPEASLDPIPGPYSTTITSTVQLTGQITETGAISIGVAGLRVGILPAAMASLADAVAVFHFDEPAGATRFANDIGTGDATCSGSACPSAGGPGTWGAAVAFSGDFNTSDDYLTADGITAAFSGTAGLSFGGWVYPDYNPGNRAFLAFNTADGGLRNQIVHDDYTLKYMDGEVEVPIGHAWDRWAYVMVTIDADGKGAAYLDGELKAEFTTSIRPDPEGRFSIGQEWDGDTPSQFFNGHVDEVFIFSRALSPAEVRSVYADAGLDASGQGVLSTGWRYIVPGGLDGLYQLNLRPYDVFGNSARRTDWPAWTGEIDTAAPAVALTIAEKSETTDAGGLNVFNTWTTYTCWARDFNLVATSATHPEYDFQCPCDTVAPLSTVISDTFYHQVSPWYAEVFSDTTRLYERTATCRVPGLATDNFMQACDAYGHCASQVADVDQAFEVIPAAYTVVLTPTHQAILTATGSTTIEARAYSRDRIQQVEIYDGVALVGAVLVDATCTGNITTTQWTQAWVATDGAHSLTSRVIPCTGDTATSVSNLVRVDSLPPLPPVWPFTLNRQQRLSYGRVALSGQASDAPPGTGVTRVEVSVDGGAWAEASLQGGNWCYEWYLGEEPDNAQYNVAVRASDFAGWSTQAAHAVTVDLDAPNPITLSLTSDVTAGGVVSPGLTLRQIPATLDLTWQASEPPEKLLNYQVLWTVDTPTQTLQIPAVVPPGGPLSSTYQALFDAQRIEPSVTSVFTDGNTQLDDWGPVYVDTPLTPDYIEISGYRPYREWMDSGCSLVGVDRRIAESAQSGAALDSAQNLYVTWDSEALRIAWTGANWDYNGDLFVYLDTLGDPSVPLTAFNPFSNTQQTTLNIPGAKAFIWVQGSQLAQMGYWNGTSFQQTVLNSSQYRFDTGLAGGTTDLYIPFDLLGIIAPAATPLMLYAFATDEGALRLWSTMPPANPVNSNLVVDTGIFAGDDYIFGMIQFYFWPSLGPGICPNTPGGLEPLYVDSDLRFSLSADPVGSTYSFMGDGLFWLQEELMDPNRPADFSESFTFMDVDHPFVSDGATISYTLSYENRGTVAASGVTVTVAALFGLQLVGTSPQSTTIALGDIAPGESGSVTFQGQVDLSATYTPCLTLNPGDPEICEPFRDWAAIEAVVYDNAYGIAGNPLDWLWADHRVDSEPPDSLGILWPESLIGSGINTFSGYAYDPSGVPTLTLEVHSPGTTPCPDDTPQGGVWTCQWDATAANGGIPPDDGDTFNLRLQATDPFEHSSQTDWQTFIVDSVPPTVTFSAETTATYSNTVVNRTTLAFSGQINDNRGVGDVHVCLNDDCTLANVQLEGVPSGVYDDEPATPTAIGACGGGEIGRTFIVTDSFAIGQVSLGFNADHARRNDIQATLESPSGTEVRVLFPKEGSPYAARNYDVLLNDAATSGLHDYKGDDNTAFPYYDRDARPHQPLRAFQGENSAGTWTLTICDTYPADYAGTYNRSRLVLKPQNTAVQTGNWLHTVGGLDNLDNVEQTVQVYGFDLVGNRSTETISLTFWVDNVAPVITVTAAISEVEACPNRTATTVLSGTVSDGGQVSRMYASVRTPGGSRYTGQVARDGDAWWYDLQPDATGTYTIKVTAVDAAGNTASTALYSVQVICVATDLTTALVSAETPVAASTPISLTTRVTNNGGDEVEAGLSVAFYVNGSLIGTAETAQALQAGESEDVTIIWNVDTPGDYELTIIANDDGSGARPLALCSAPGETRQTATILDVPLVKSWNLMSTYVNPFNTDASVVQRPIEGQYVVIQGFDQGAQSYYPDLPPAVNTLKDIDAEHGYWVKVTGTQGNSGELRGTEQAATWRIVGEKFAEDRAIELDAGWNLVSYLPRSPMAVADALQSIDGQYTVVLGYDQGALSYYPDIDPSFNTLQEMEPLFGYWIRMTQEGTLRYPTTGDFRFSIADLRLNALTIENRKSQIANPTNTWVNFYGPAHLPVGTVVQAIDPDGVVCGATVVTTEGQYGLLACYGDDPTTPEDEGARPGDIIQLVVDGQTLGTGVCTVFGDLHWVPLGTASHQWQVFLPLIRVGLPPANYPRR